MGRTGNPIGSKWRNTTQEERKRKKVVFTLSDEAREKLERIAPEGMRSQMVERMILEWPEEK